MSECGLVQYMGFLRKNWFLIVLVVLLVIGFLLPQIGSAISFGKTTTTVLIILIFLVTGYTLPTEAIRNGLRDIRLHLLLQIFIFVLIPFYFAVTLLLFENNFSPEAQIGIMALACLPTTISSCVIFTQASGGNTVGAMFNAALANLLGVFISPLLISFFLSNRELSYGSVALGSVFLSISVKVLLPIIVGQIAHRVRAPGKVLKGRLKVTTNLALLLIIFINFSKSAADASFRRTLPEMVYPFAYLAVSFLVLLGISYLIARANRFSRENTIAILYTAPQKTLAMGVPLLTTLFADSPELLGTALLPLLFYHPWQLLVSGFLKGWLTGKESR